MPKTCLFFVCFFFLQQTHPWNFPTELQTGLIIAPTFENTTNSNDIDLP